jgi:formylglycine-generating enzyme required for sulfatase activity/transcriptional regulator with XRE-family HTH domain
MRRAPKTSKLSERLSDTIHRSGLTQREVAQILGVKAPTLNLWVKGRAAPRRSDHPRIEALARFLNSSVSDIRDWITFVEPSDLVAADQLTEARRAYFEYLQSRYNFLELRGMGVHDRVPIRLRVLDVYVPLRVHRALPAGETWERERNPYVAGRRLTPDQARQVGNIGRHSEPILDLLNQHTGLVVLGDPGAGKTTFLLSLTLQCAAQTLELGGRRDWLPILLPLSAYASALEHHDVRLDDLVASYFRDRGLDVPVRDLLNDALRRGCALMLLDGLDEVRDLSRRQHVAAQVADFVAAHRSGNKFVLTSRIVGYRDVRSAAQGLVECTVLDFDCEDIAAFAYNWTQALETLARGSSVAVEGLARQERDELIASIHRHPGVRALATNPLLLTILALMRRQGVVLPERRVELYTKYVETLLRHWNLARSLGRPPADEFDSKQTLRVLAPLALWIHETEPGSGLVGRERLLRYLTDLYLRRATAEPEKAAMQFMADVHEHAGLLVERGAGSYGFPHLSFQEYLAAWGLAMRGQTSTEVVSSFLAERIEQSAWNEVILLVIGILGVVQEREEAASTVVEEVLRKASKNGPAVALMGEAVADSPQSVTPMCRQDIVERLARTMREEREQPMVRGSAGAVLERLGDPRFDPSMFFLPVKYSDGSPEPLLGFVEIPGGPCILGANPQVDLDANPKWEPVRRCEVPKFYIARYPVTQAQFQAFLDHEKDSAPTFRQTRGHPNHPVTNVPLEHALMYCKWLTAQLRELTAAPETIASLLLESHWCVRLPTEDEWEKAARGANDVRRYPWGDVFDPNRANSSQSEIDGTTVVGCFHSGRSPYGIEDMAGGVWEWTLPRSEDSVNVLRGGAFNSEPRELRCSHRYHYHYYPEVREPHNCGFRVVIGAIM